MLNLQAPVNKLSYGYVCRNIIKELYKLDSSVKLIPIGPISFEEKEKEVIDTCLENSKFDTTVKIFHQHNLYIEEKNKIGFPIFELDNFSEEEKKSLSSVGRLFVCSDWARDLVKDYADTRVIPLGVDRSIFYPREVRRSNKVVFLNIGKWEKRKGHEILYGAFLEAFKDVDDVELWMVPKNNFISKEKERKWTNHYKELGNKVKLIPPLSTSRQIAELINRSDVGVYPYLAEGWCMPILESLSCGKRVIATNYSAPTQYLNQDNSVLINPDGLEYAFDDTFFNGVGKWAFLGGTYLRTLVDALRAEYKIAKDRVVNEAGIKTAEEFSWEKTAKMIMQNISP